MKYHTLYAFEVVVDFVKFIIYKILFMKRFIFINALFSSLFCFAQSADKKSDTEQEIKRLMKDWMIAVMKKDEKTLDKIVAPEFKLDDVYQGFPPVSRKTWMENTMRHLKVDSVHYYYMKVDIVDNVAIVGSRFYCPGKFGDRPPFVDSTGILVDTWMKRKQGWQVVSRLRR